MPIYSRDNRREFETAPEGLHQAVCCDVVDLGMMPTQWGEKLKAEIRWQTDTKDSEGRRHLVVARFTNTLHEKGRLRPLLEAWRGRKFTTEELKQFDLEKLLHANCQIQLVHNVAENGKKYANVQAIVPLGKGQERIDADPSYVRVCDRKVEDHIEAAADEDAEAVPF
jgi:hypothetical protein